MARIFRFWPACFARSCNFFRKKGNGPSQARLANAVSLRGFVSRSAALSQKAALQMLLSVTTPPVKRQFWKIRVCVAMKAPVGLSSGRAVCVSRWRGFAPTSSAARVCRAVNEQRQGITVTVISCLLLCGIKFALCELGHHPI